MKPSERVQKNFFQYCLNYLNSQTLKLGLFVVAMFGFGYALVPLYKVFCELTQINQVTKADETSFLTASRLRNSQVDTSRSVTIIFDANARGPFGFRPLNNSLTVHPGQLAQINYQVANQQSRSIQAQAVPSYAPSQAAQYFSKIECFCFQQQTLAAHETKNMPVVFVIDPKLPADIRSITLSYTFFEVGSGPVSKPQATMLPESKQQESEQHAKTI